MKYTPCICLCVVAIIGLLVVLTKREGMEKKEESETRSQRRKRRNKEALLTEKGDAPLSRLRKKPDNWYTDGKTSGGKWSCDNTACTNKTGKCPKGFSQVLCVGDQNATCAVNQRASGCVPDKLIKG